MLSDVPGNRDMIKENGMLFRYGDLNDLKSCIEVIRSSSPDELKAMSEMSRELYATRWTLDAIFNKWLNLLDRY